MHAYFVTLYKTLDPVSPSDFRTVGFLQTEEIARVALCSNRLDLHEGVYNYATIEKVSDGLYNSSRSTLFFKWDGDAGKYVPIEKPAHLDHFINFSGIG